MTRLENDMAKAGMKEKTLLKLVEMFRGILDQDGWETCLMTLNTVYKPEIAREVARRLGRKQMQPVNLNKLLANYYDTGLYLAVTRDRTQVVGTGKTMEAALEDAVHKDYKDPIIMRAPSKDMGRQIYL